MSAQAVLAAIDGGDGSIPQLEVGLVHAWLGDDVHAQAELNLCVVVAQPALGAVGNIVHRHNGCCAVGCLDGFLRQVLLCFLRNLRQHGVIAGCGGRCQQAAPELLLVQVLGTGQGAQVELLILGVLR